MNKFKNCLGLLGLSLSFGSMIMGCGMNGESRAPSFANDTQIGSPPLGGFNLNCKGGSQQQQQSSYQQQESCGKNYGRTYQSFQFVESKVSDFDLQLDCDNNYVSAQAKGQNSQQAYFPIQQDGSVKGKMNYQQQMQSDGKGNQQCYVQIEVDFDGKANCGRQRSNQQQQLSLDTKVNFKQSQQQDLLSDTEDFNESPRRTPVGYASDVTAVPDPYAGPVPNPYPGSGDENGRNNDRNYDRNNDRDYGRSRDRTRRPAAEPEPAPRPNIIRKKVCVVENPCPIVSKTNMSCPSYGGFEGP